MVRLGTGQTRHRERGVRGREMEMEVEVEVERGMERGSVRKREGKKG